MNQKTPKLRIAAVGDLHGHEASVGLHAPFFKQVSEEADVLLLCGDLSNNGLPEEAKSLAQDLSNCAIPILAVLGNHDYESGRIVEFKKILSDVGVWFLEDESRWIDDVGFAGARGFGGGFDNYMLSSFGEPATKMFVGEAVSQALKLENQLKNLDTPNKIVVLHYAPIVDTVKGEPLEIYPFLGNSRLGEVIDRFDVKAVFHGHAHHGSYEGKTSKGITVYNCTYEMMKKKNPNKPFAFIEI